MRDRFVQTSNTARFAEALDALQDRGAAEACLMVIDGEPGYGKSRTIEWWAVQQGCVYLRAKKEWTPAWMMRELLGSLNVPPAHSFERMYAQALDTLGQRALQAQRDDGVFAVVVDEVDHIVRAGGLLESLRDLSDMLEIPFILVGMGKVRSALVKFPQVASRVSRYVAFEAASLADVTALVQGLCEVDVAPDLVRELHQLSGGYCREIMEGIANIERFGRRSGETVTVAAMEGEVLLHDRRTSAPIRVKG